MNIKKEYTMSTERLDRVAVITRLHFKTDDRKYHLFDEIFAFYRDVTLKSLQSQTDKDFDIWVWCEPHHDELFKGLGVNVFHAEAEIVYTSGKYFTDYTEFANTSGLPKYVAVIGLDGDDELKPNAIAELKKYLKGGRKAISLQPIKRDVDTGKFYNMKSYKKRQKLSPIFCLYQPDEPYLFAYEYGHYSGMPKQFDEKVYLDDLAIMNIHSRNDSTAITEWDTEI